MRKVFYSFQYKPDNWRVSQIKKMGAIEGNKLLHDNKWEEVKQKGDAAIRNWIDDNLKDKSCTIVLIGSDTANRKWINYEINKTWESNNALLGIYIHKLKCRHGNTTTKGKNPFDSVEVNNSKLSSKVKCYDPPYLSSTDVYSYIKENIAGWVEEAIETRKKF